MTRPTLALVMLLSLGHVQAQQAAAAAGGQASGSGGSTSYTVGQVANSTHSAASGSIAQGVQQPYSVLPTSLETGPDGLLLLTAFPNPTTDVLTLHTNTLTSPAAEARLYAVDGSLVRQQVLEGTDTSFDLKNLALGKYTLVVRDGDRPLGTFSVIKH
jgi:hypothetical protein